MTSCGIIERMNDIQEVLAQLRDKGWTWAAIARELGVHRETVSRWWAGTFYPDHPRVFVVVLEGLLRRRRIPKQKVYKKTPSAPEN